MTMGRFSLLIASSLFIVSLLGGQASAGFFGFGSDDKGKSGLDFNRGYDVNTVATVSGKVTSLPQQGDREQYVLQVSTRSEVVNVTVGPRSFWEKKGIPIHLNDEVTAKGSKAQGEDGKTYLLTQKLVNRSTGGQMDLRSGKGEPVWTGRGAAGMGLDRSSSRISMGGMLMRGGGMMMRH